MPFRILVVEDEKAVCQLLARILTLPRFDVIQALTTEEARQHLAPPPSLIILDLGLAGESGEVFCHSVHRDPITHHVPILIITGRPTPDLADSSVATCAQEIIHKPFDVAELVFHVETLLKKAAYDLRHFPNAVSVKEKV
jgi:DNA-binding response OmpR family regulator